MKGVKKKELMYIGIGGKPLYKRSILLDKVLHKLIIIIDEGTTFSLIDNEEVGIERVTWKVKRERMKKLYHNV